MPAMNAARARACFVAAFLALGALAAAGARADIYAAAVAHQGRSAEDLERDPIDHPAEVLRLSGIGPGMRVGDVLAAGGYYSELLSYIVGPRGHVIMLNNRASDYWSDNYWEKRLANRRLPNVEHRLIDLEHLPLADASLDAEILIKDYHDLYWVDPDRNSPWPKMNPAKVLDEMARVLKPGGILLLVDHSAKRGTGSADAGRLHRIDEAFARADFERHGFELVATSDVLRRPDDARDQLSYKPPALGKTDRFVMVFHKHG
ncbi:MAG TPA: methyltransferase domain-containing protein [Steroidobacteraceae bacterium]|nr:methyltransferase domain-containing protein [Steroidobacteraceae bacterium]